jgi:hypothetical protein
MVTPHRPQCLLVSPESKREDLGRGPLRRGEMVPPNGAEKLRVWVLSGRAVLRHELLAPTMDSKGR